MKYFIFIVLLLVCLSLIYLLYLIYGKLRQPASPLNLTDGTESKVSPSSVVIVGNGETVNVKGGYIMIRLNDDGKIIDVRVDEKYAEGFEPSGVDADDINSLITTSDADDEEYKKLVEAAKANAALYVSPTVVNGNDAVE